MKDPSSRTSPPTVKSGATAAFAPADPRPGLLLAWAPPHASPTDRAAIRTELVVGRSTRATWTISDERLSGLHFRVRRFGEGLVGEDLGSTNGTLVRGETLGSPRPLAPGDVVRAGHCLFVVEGDLGRLESDAERPDDLAGRFHAPAIGEALALAARTGRHVLLVGESGTGKEIGAQWLGRARPRAKLVAHNCARFASAEEAEATLFGVERGVFSGVDARAGLLEEADGGTLFLDEVHVLPLRVQRSLLRFAEDGRHARIGGATSRALDVRLVLATNLSADAPELAQDLVARLYVVELPPLGARRADLPEIFLEVLRRRAATPGDHEELRAAIGADHFEAILLEDLAGRNVRALETLADEIVARLPDVGPDEAVRDAFASRLSRSKVAQRAPADEETSRYEQNKEKIVAAFHAARGNVSETERVLAAEGLRLHRRWLAEFLRRWGVRVGRKRPKAG